MKISFNSDANKTNFQMLFAFSLAFVMRLKSNRKWPTLTAKRIPRTIQRFVHFSLKQTDKQT